MARRKSARTVARTLERIDSLRQRIAEGRTTSTMMIALDNTAERDVILKGLELLRETIHTGQLVADAKDSVDDLP